MNKLINEVITDIRKKHKLSRKGLESVSGFKERTIGSYERGESRVSEEYIEFMSLYFGYTEDYIHDVSSSLLDDGIRTILMYKSIYNYDNEKMSELLGFDLTDYVDFVKKNNLSRDNIHFILHLAIKLNINFYNLGKKLPHQVQKLKKGIFNNYLNSNMAKYFSEYENINDFENRLNENLSSGLEITPEYYANIIKKRNQPKENYTPISEANELPDKYKEIIELLPFAPDSFIDTLIEKLKTLKETQQLWKNYSLYYLIRNIKSVNHY